MGVLYVLLHNCIIAYLCYCSAHWHHHKQSNLFPRLPSSQFIAYTYPSLKKLAYIPLVSPKRQYPGSLWNPWQNNLINFPDVMQDRATRPIFSIYSRHASMTQVKAKNQLEPLTARHRAVRILRIHMITTTTYSLQRVSASLPLPHIRTHW